MTNAMDTTSRPFRSALARGTAKSLVNNLLTGESASPDGGERL